MTTSSVTVGVLVEFEGMEWSPAHDPIAEGAMQLASALYEELEDENCPVSIVSASPFQLQISYVSSRSAQLQVSCISSDPTQPPSSISSAYKSQFLSPAFAVSLQCLGSSSYSTPLCG